MINYWSKKELMKEKARDHISNMYARFPGEIRRSINNTLVYTVEDCEKLLKASEERESLGTLEVQFKRMCIEDAVFACKGKGKLAVLNFASYKNPGGMFLNGSIAQEESICHNSTLYPVLTAFNDTFYHYNRENKNKSLYKHRLLYSPDIVFIDKNGKTRYADVITMAAPNRGAALRNNVSEDEIETVMKERIRIILHVAYSNLVDSVFLGAYGCGVFKNEPEVVSNIFFEEMQKYNMYYEFPIPDAETFNTFYENIGDGILSL